jgi:cytoplasmic iron level regulating protein YaaA (DUF328/UPF0246 family)
MFALISPAKKLDMEQPAPVEDFSQPQFMVETLELVAKMRTLSRAELGGLMKLSDKLTELNYERYRRFATQFDLTTAKQAAYAFQGDTYVGLQANDFDKEDLIYAQDHLGILSGLYGLLRPLDLMQAYRLEMGTKLKTDKGATLYDFWEDKLTQTVNTETQDHTDRTVINLASNEYISAVQPENFAAGMITPQFKEMKDGKPKMIGLFAKRARGMMANYMIKNRIETPEGLKDFDMDGYKFQPKGSDENSYLFLRG